MMTDSRTVKQQDTLQTNCISLYWIQLLFIYLLKYTGQKPIMNTINQIKLTFYRTFYTIIRSQCVERLDVSIDLNFNLTVQLYPELQHH